MSWRATKSRSAPDRRTMPIPPRPGAVATAAIRSAVLLFATLDEARDLPLLGDRQNVVGRPVQHQTGREPEEHEGKNDGMAIMTRLNRRANWDSPV